MGFILEANAGWLELTISFDVNRCMRVDQDIVDGWIRKEGLDRPKTHHLIHYLVGEGLKLFLVKRDPLLRDIVVHEALDMAAQLLGAELVQKREIELVDDPPV